jgi:hypothetical protein
MWLVAVMFFASLMGSAGHARQHAAGTSGSGQLSPSVTATFTARGPSPNGPWTLELLVLWRGTPGWLNTKGMLAGAGADDPAGGGRRLVTQTAFVAGRPVEVQFNPQTREARLRNQVFAVGDSNVLLVDEVDGPGGPKIVGSVRVEPFMDAGDDIDAFVRQSPRLLKFLSRSKPAK